MEHVSMTFQVGPGYKLRLALGIADPRTLETRGKEVDWIAARIRCPAQGRLLRDFLLATQDSCLAYDYRKRAAANSLKEQLEGLKEALAELGQGSSEVRAQNPRHDTHDSNHRLGSHSCLLT